MSNEMHWGGINVRGLCKAVFSDIWMVIAVMVITYLGLGIVGNMRYTPSYISRAVVAVYPFDQMYTLETSSSALETVGAVSEVFNSEMFKTGLENRLEEPADYSLSTWQVDRTFILMLSVTSASPEKAYQILRAALDYYGEISSHLVGDSHLEILSEPDFPVSAVNTSGILKHRPLVTLFMGFAMGGFLILRYVMRKTYKSPSAIQNSYKNVRFFRTSVVASDKHSRRNKRGSGSAENKETIRKTALEVLQMLRAKVGSSVFVTSAAHNEGKTEVTVSLAREMAGFGRTVLIVETDPENTDMTEHFDVSDILPQNTLSVLLQDKAVPDNDAAAASNQGIKVMIANTDTQDDSIPFIAEDIRNQSIKVIIANTDTQDEIIPLMAEDAKKILTQAEKLADVILVDGCVWTEFGDGQIWREAADTSLAVCGQDKADFNAIDRMMTNLQDDDPAFLGCILNGF